MQQWVGVGRTAWLSIGMRRGLHTSIVPQAGQKLRIQQGLGRSGNEFGFLHDEPDFYYEDGRKPEVTPKQRKWMNKRKRTQQRVDRLLQEMDEGRERILRAEAAANATGAESKK
mmetsp:Transcript_35036/g.98801  ORF Transcript_35036/g.98801 Transcript_35036/m.98801 type:complete len:114 (+) Transcript_35036:86-427(+)|eukprot:CAMPEP_0119124536 /NCGR_PEP_ID=MMETSP1310-20130426/4132_1 /TAXON_ID=464262 /ORGANISM="Genus nov. species nov., Strain RCC2339" /LENGTH=113 /DNA_ID=CAMNT_0007114501 /DNA_START=91 /DNA_END=432 /DNA_ORIENTATION=+